MNNNVIYRKSYSDIQLRKKEVLRYAGVFGAECEELNAVVDECMKECNGIFSCAVCYRVFDIDVAGDGSGRITFYINDDNTDVLKRIKCFELVSKDLTKNLKGCNKAVLFAATVGMKMDMLINKYSRISPVKSLIMQAVGAEAVESLCDKFCDELPDIIDPQSQLIKTCPRFSPGYGDVPLDFQKEVAGLLEIQKNLGITLNENLLMSPSKSVTAFVGITK